MDIRDYFMDEIWPLLTDAQRQELVDFAAWLAQYAPPCKDDDNKPDTG